MGEFSSFALVPEQGVVPELSQLPGRFALHSARIVLDHPVTGALIERESPLPEALRRLLSAGEWE